jgi:hypothetical protein
MPSHANVRPVSSPDEAYSQHGGSTARVSAPTGMVRVCAGSSFDETVDHASSRGRRSMSTEPLIPAMSPPTAPAMPRYTARYSRRMRSIPRSASSAIHSGLVPTSTRSPTL